MLPILKRTIASFNAEKRPAIGFVTEGGIGRLGHYPIADAAPSTDGRETNVDIAIVNVNITEIWATVEGRVWAPVAFPAR